MALATNRSRRECVILKKGSTLFVALIAVVSSVIFPLQAFAKDDSFYQQNNILFYDPDATSCSTAVTSASVAAVKLDANDATLKQIFTLLVQSGQFNGVQAAAVMGNMYAESGFNSNAHEVGNDIGYGLVQWSFGRRVSLENFAKQKGVPASDIPMQIEFLTNEYNNSYRSKLSKTAFGQGTDVSSATEAWMNGFEVPFNKPPSADYPKLQTKRIPAAVQIYGFFKDSAPSTANATVGSQNCSSSNAIVAGSIVQTAINLALPQPASNGKTAKSDARDSYQTAKEQYNPEADWSDCGGYIATVMIASGVDPNYVKVGVTSQEAYVKAHPEKYTIITNPTVADLQPGDILISSQAGHTTMYLGDNSSGYPAADASLGQRVPSLRDISNSTWMIANGAIIARYNGQTK